MKIEALKNIITFPEKKYVKIIVAKNIKDTIEEYLPPLNYFQSHKYFVCSQL